MKKFSIIFILLLILSSSFVLIYSRLRNFTRNESHSVATFKDITLHVGSISDSPKRNQEEYSALANYLTAKLGVKNTEVVIAQSPLEMAVLLKQNKVDLFIDNPFSSEALQTTAQSEMVFGTEENGSQSYNSVIAVTKNSKIKQLDDLKGKIIAFKSSDSASSYFLPKADLLNRGYTLTQKDTPDSKVLPTEIGYYFSNDNEATLKLLYRGKIAAGAMSLSNLKENSLDYPEAFRVLANTESIAHHIVSFRKDLSPVLRESLIGALHSIKSDARGKVALSSLEYDNLFLLKDSPEILDKTHTLSSFVANETLTH